MILKPVQLKHYPETGLPNTNNGLEDLFSDLKTKVRVHGGIGTEDRKKLLDEYIKRHCWDGHRSRNIRPLPPISVHQKANSVDKPLLDPTSVHRKGHPVDKMKMLG